jgi:ketosteroid isomerase-like protein
MSVGKNRRLALDLVEHWFDAAWLEHNCHDEFRLIYHADPVAFSPAGEPPIVKSGLQAFQAAARVAWRDLPTVRVYGLVVADDNSVALQVSVTGTTPAGDDLVVRNAFFVEVQDDRIHRLHTHVDTAAASRAKMGDRLTG